MEKRKVKNKILTQILPDLNEITLKIRLDLLKINNAKKNLIKEDLARDIIKKDNLFERLSAYKGINLDKDILLASRKYSTKNDEKFQPEINEPVYDVNVNVLKYNERNDELSKKNGIYKNYHKKEEKIKKNKFLSMSDNNYVNMSHLDRIKILIENAEEKVFLKNFKF